MKKLSGASGNADDPDPGAKTTTPEGHAPDANQETGNAVCRRCVYVPGSGIVPWIEVGEQRRTRCGRRRGEEKESGTENERWSGDVWRNSGCCRFYWEQGLTQFPRSSQDTISGAAGSCRCGGWCFDAQSSSLAGHILRYRENRYEERFWEKLRSNRSSWSEPATSSAPSTSGVGC